MEHSLACPHCGQIVLNQPALAGQIVECPSCCGQFQLPMLAVAVPSLASSLTRNAAKRPPTKRKVWPWVLGFFLIGLTNMGLVKLGVYPKGDPKANDKAKLERDERRNQQAIDREKSRQHEQEMADIFSGKNGRNQSPTMRFGLTESQRREFFRELVLLEDRFGIHTPKANAAKDALCLRYNITREQATEIFVESHEQNWPLPPIK